MRAQAVVSINNLTSLALGESKSLLAALRDPEVAVLFDDTERRFLDDGDSVVLRGAAKGRGYRIGFGECVGTVMPAIDQPDWTME